MSIPYRDGIYVLKTRRDMQNPIDWKKHVWRVAYTTKDLDLQYEIDHTESGELKDYHAFNAFHKSEVFKTRKAAVAHAETLRHLLTPEAYEGIIHIDQGGDGFPLLEDGGWC